VLVTVTVTVNVNVIVIESIRAGTQVREDHDYE
jgi:hypothetical protein